jgi:hypothetical protein
LFSALTNEVREQIPESECKMLCRQVNPTVHRCAPDLITEIAVSGARAVKHRFVIEGIEFEGIMLYWPYGRPLCAFRLSQVRSPGIKQASKLVGTSFGITFEELIQLLEQLVDITKDSDLMSSYRNQEDEYQARVRAAYGNTKGPRMVLWTL